MGIAQDRAHETIDRIRNGAAGAYADAAREMPAVLAETATRIADAVLAMNRERGYGVD